MTLQAKIAAYYELCRKIREMEEQRKMLGQDILNQMSDKTMKMGTFVAKKYERLSIKTSLEEARTISATKTEEIVDKDKIKTLHRLGQHVPGVSLISYVTVSTFPKMSAPIEEAEEYLPSSLDEKSYF